MTIVETLAEYGISPIMAIILLGIIVSVIFVIVKKFKRCKHNWKITYHDKQNSFYCVKCGKKSKGVKR